nr:hypothetical protein GCM10025732_15230 [Glycomyces mayteni]
MKRRSFVAAASATSLLSLAACAEPQQGTFTPAPIVPVVSLDAVDDHDPSQPFNLTVVDGILEEVNVTSDRSKTIEGDFAEDLTSWTSKGVMDAGSVHTVAAKAVSSDGTVTEFEQTFTTERRDGTGFGVADVTPIVEGETVGVGAPIIVFFTEDAPDRAEVEKNLVVESELGHEGRGTGSATRRRSTGPRSTGSRTRRSPSRRTSTACSSAATPGATRTTRRSWRSAARRPPTRTWRPTP